MKKIFKQLLYFLFIKINKNYNYIYLNKKYVFKFQNISKIFIIMKNLFYLLEY